MPFLRRSNQRGLQVERLMDWGLIAFVLIVLHLGWHLWIGVRDDVRRRMEP